MGYLNEMYGKRSSEFVRGVLVGIYYCSDCLQGMECFGSRKTLQEFLQEVVEDLAENPENFNVREMIERGYV